MTALTQTTPLGRARAWLTAHHLAQLALLVQPLIVVRTGGEYFRLRWVGSEAITALIEPLFISLAAVGITTICSLLLYFNGRDKSVLGLTLAAIAALVVYKLVAMPGLG